MPTQISLGASLTGAIAVGGFPQLDIIRTEGDQMMNGTGGVELKSTLASLLGTFSVVNTSEGASDIADISARMSDVENTWLGPQTTVIFDGKPNAYIDAQSYCDDLAEALMALKHNRFVLIPPIVPYGSAYSGSIAEAVTTEMTMRWPDNVLDWRNWLENSEGLIALTEFQNAPSDSWSLSQSGVDHLAIGIVWMLEDKQWLPPTGTILWSDFFTSPGTLAHYTPADNSSKPAGHVGLIIQDNALRVQLNGSGGGARADWDLLTEPLDYTVFVRRAGGNAISGGAIKVDNLALGATLTGGGELKVRSFTGSGMVQQMSLVSHSGTIGQHSDFDLIVIAKAP